MRDHTWTFTASPSRGLGSIYSFKNSIQLAEGVTVGHLKEADPPNPLAALFSGGAPSSKEAGERADTYIFINATCIELLNVRTYFDKARTGGE